MRPILSILIYTNCWVALCVCSLVFGISTHYHLDHSALYTFWSFTGTVSAYQLHRIIRLRQLKHTVRSNRRLLWMQNTYTFQLIWLGINALSFGILSLQLPLTFSTIYLIVLNAIVVGLYALPIPIIGNGIRTLPFVKNILISTSWTCIILIPFTSELTPFPWQLPLSIFVAVFAQIIPFDARDKNYDDKRMKTIPQVFGTENSRYIGFVLFITALLLDYFILGFHSIMIIAAFVAIPGHFIRYKVGYQLRLEFMWELPLGVIGIWFLLS